MKYIPPDLRSYGMLEQLRMLYLALYNPRVMTRVMRRLEELGLEYKGVYETQRTIHGVVLADSEGLKYLESYGIEVRGPLIRADDVERAVARALVFARGLRPPLNTLIVGVDLGRSIGLAAVGDSRVLLTKMFSSTPMFLDTLFWVIENIESSRRSIRIGFTRSTFDESKAVIVDRIAKLVPSDVELELVPERGSSRLRPGAAPRGLRDDEIAALNIALGRTL